MDENQHNAISRRSLVKSGICALTGIAIASLAGTKTWAADKKLAKSSVCNTRTRRKTKVRTAMTAPNSYQARQPQLWALAK